MTWIICLKRGNFSQRCPAKYPRIYFDNVTENTFYFGLFYGSSDLSHSISGFNILTSFSKKGLSFSVKRIVCRLPVLIPFFSTQEMHLVTFKENHSK